MKICKGVSESSANDQRHTRCALFVTKRLAKSFSFSLMSIKVSKLCPYTISVDDSKNRNPPSKCLNWSFLPPRRSPSPFCLAFSSDPSHTVHRQTDLLRKDMFFRVWRLIWTFQCAFGVKELVWIISPSLSCLIRTRTTFSRIRCMSAGRRGG